MWLVPSKSLLRGRRRGIDFGEAEPRCRFPPVRLGMSCLVHRHQRFQGRSAASGQRLAARALGAWTGPGSAVSPGSLGRGVWSDCDLAELLAAVMEQEGVALVAADVVAVAPAGFDCPSKPV